MPLPPKSQFSVPCGPSPPMGPTVKSRSLPCSKKVPPSSEARRGRCPAPHLGALCHPLSGGCCVARQVDITPSSEATRAAVQTSLDLPQVAELWDHCPDKIFLPNRKLGFSRPLTLGSAWLYQEISTIINYIVCVCVHALTSNSLMNSTASPGPR